MTYNEHYAYQSWLICLLYEFHGYVCSEVAASLPECEKTSPRPGDAANSEGTYLVTGLCAKRKVASFLDIQAKRIPTTRPSTCHPFTSVSVSLQRTRPSSTLRSFAVRIHQEKQKDQQSLRWETLPIKYPIKRFIGAQRVGIAKGQLIPVRLLENRNIY